MFPVVLYTDLGTDPFVQIDNVYYSNNIIHSTLFVYSW